MFASIPAVGRVLALAAVLMFVSITPSIAGSVSATAPSYESQVVDRTNDVRVDRDKVRVRAQSCVDRWAEGQARWMAKTGNLEHRSGRLRKMLKSCKLSSVSENIAYGYSSGSKVVSAWQQSSGHRKNMLAGKMRYIGVGAVNKDGVWYVAQVFGTRK